MNIQPTPGAASLAGTARAQAHGTDSDRLSPSADVASNPALGAISGVEAGSKSQDRDADGRQLLEQQDQHGKPRHHDSETPTPPDAEPTAERPAPAPGSPGFHLDFEA